jgi:DNA topoisomerase-3
MPAIPQVRLGGRRHDPPRRSGSESQPPPTFAWPRYIEAAPQRLYCPACDDTYSLPQGGKIMSYMDLRCPLDDFELVLFSTGAKGRAYPVCPYCFSNPPFEGMTKGTEQNGGCRLSWIFVPSLAFRLSVYTPPFPPDACNHGRCPGQGCNGCLHPTCEHSAIQLGVCTCLECGTGLLVIDETRLVIRPMARRPPGPGLPTC